MANNVLRYLYTRVHQNRLSIKGPLFFLEWRGWAYPRGNQRCARDIAFLGLINDQWRVQSRFLCALAKGCGAISINQSRVLRVAPPAMMHLPRDIVINRATRHRPHVCKDPSLPFAIYFRNERRAIRTSKQILWINQCEKLALKLGLYNFLDSSNFICTSRVAGSGLDTECFILNYKINREEHDVGKSIHISYHDWINSYFK